MQNVIPARAVHAALNRISHHASLERIRLHAIGDARIRRKWRAGLGIADKFNRQQQTHAANIAHHRKFPQRLERLAQFAPCRLDARKKIFLLDVIQHRIPRRRGNRMRVVSESVQKSRRCPWQLPPPRGLPRSPHPTAHNRSQFPYPPESCPAQRPSVPLQKVCRCGPCRSSLHRRSTKSRAAGKFPRCAARNHPEEPPRRASLRTTGSKINAATSFDPSRSSKRSRSSAQSTLHSGYLNPNGQR